MSPASGRRPVAIWVAGLVLITVVVFGAAASPGLRDRALVIGELLAGLLAIAALLIGVGSVAAGWQVLRRHRHLQQQIDTHKLHLDTAIGNMSQGLLLFDASQRVVLLNRRYIEMYGLSPDIVKPGCILRELICHRKEVGSFSGDADRYCAEIESAIACGRTTSATIDTPDGRSIHVVNQPLAGGGWIATHEDITEQRQAERERDENRKFLNLIIENVPAAIAVRDAVTRKYVLTNRAIDDLWKFHRAEAIGKTPHELFPKELADSMTARDDMVLQSNEPADFEEQEASADPNNVRIVKSKRFVVRDEHGQPKYLVSVLEDVTERRRIQHERDRAKEFLDMIIENVPTAIAVKDARTRKYVLLNRAANDLWSVDRSEAIGKTAQELFERVCADDVDARDEETLRADHPIILEDLPNIANPGDGRITTTKRLAIRDGDGRPTLIISVIEDVTERHRAQMERDRNKEFLDLIIEHVPSTIIVKDARDFRYVLINRAGESQFGMQRSQILGRTHYDVLPRPVADYVNDLDQRLLSARDQPIVEERTLALGDNPRRTLLTKGLCIRGSDDEPQYLLAVVDDITQHKEAEARIAHLAYNDALTGLPNRVQFRERLEHELAFVKRGSRLALLYLDLDHFKGVNDTLGHSVGDQLLQAVAARLNMHVRESDIVARLGGDEFALVQSNLANPGDAAIFAQRLREAVVQEPYELSGHQVVIDVSIGIALAPDDGTNADQLLRHADLALYGAKAEGRGGYRYFEAEMDARMKMRRTLEVDLRQALAEGQFELFYQPVVDSQRGSVSGCEALLRWNHPVRGLVPPAEFIPIAEETGLIVPIGEWVLRQASSDAVTWPIGVKVAVNLSPVQIKSQSFTLLVATILAESGLAPERLEFEITESVLMQSNEANLGVLHLLRELGVRFAMDDFGTGYSSLSYLRSFPFDKIKIDRSFIGDLSKGAESRTIVDAVVTLARGLGMTATAEGVETEDQLQILRAIGCDEIQGFLFSEPRPAIEIAGLFRRKLKLRTVAA